MLDFGLDYMPVQAGANACDSFLSDPLCKAENQEGPVHPMTSPGTAGELVQMWCPFVAGDLSAAS